MALDKCPRRWTDWRLSPFGDEYLPKRLPVPCRCCGELACTLEIPVLEPSAAMLLRPVFRFAAVRLGVDLSDFPENPLEAIPPVVFAEVLAVTCASCVASDARPKLAVVG